MWGILVFAVALCLVGNTGVSGEGEMGRLHWCNTLCMCRDSSHVEVKCFSRSDIYDLLDFKRIQVIKLERINWQLENQVLWCNNTCLCHQNNDAKVFKCVEEDTLKQFISDQIGDEYFYQDEESADVRPQEDQDDGGEEEAREIEHRKRSEERRKNRRNRKPRKRVKNRQQMSRVVTAPTTTPVPPTPEVVEVVTTPPTEVFVTALDERESWQPPSLTPVILTSGAPTSSSTASSLDVATVIVTVQTPYEAPRDPVEPDAAGEDERDGEEEEKLEEEVEPQHTDDEDAVDDAELLPKQEAVAASPAVTAMQPPTRRQPFPPTASSHAATREAETMKPKVSAVLEVPVQRKTVASEVSQDLDELGSAVMQIKSDVVLNQRILLVTVAVAGIAMLGVLVLAVHSCLASKRQAAAEERRLKESPKEDNHVTKVNLEEAW